MCSMATDLATISSPYSSSTASEPNDFTFTCGSDRGAPDKVFFYDLGPAQELSIWQSSNNYDSMHQLRRGGECPGEAVVACTDDPDTRAHSWLNTDSSPQRVYFIVSGYGSSRGAFTLRWEVVDRDAAGEGEPPWCIWQCRCTHTYCSLSNCWLREQVKAMRVLVKTMTVPMGPPMRTVSCARM